MSTTFHEKINFSPPQLHDSRDYIARFLLNICEHCQKRDDGSKPHQESQIFSHAPSINVALVTKPLMTCSADWTQVDDLSSLEDINNTIIAAQNKSPPDSELSGAENEKLNMADIFHILADSLPQNSEFVDVLWLSHLGMTAITDDIALFGALKRLVVWHRAQMYITSASDEALSEEEQQWVDLLHADVLPPGSDCRQAVWRGFVTLTEEQGAKSTHLPRFSLHKSPRQHCPFTVKESNKSDDSSEYVSQTEASIMSPCLDFLTMLPRSQVPDFYISHHCYSLQVSSPSRCLHKSRRFINHLHQNKELCYLVRLSYGITEDEGSPVRKKKAEDSVALKRCTNDWRDMVIDDITTIVECEPSKLTQCVSGHHHFLLQASADDSQDSCTAHLFHPIDSIDGAVGHHLTMLGMSTKPRASCCDLDDEYFDMLLQDLPFQSGEELITMHQMLEKLQAETLEHWIELQKKQEQPPALTFSKLTHILHTVRERFKEFVSTTDYCERPQPKNTSTRILPIKPAAGWNIRLIQSRMYLFQTSSSWSMSLRKIVTETEWNMETTLERAALILYDTQQTEFRKTKSNSSIGGLSPPPHGKILTLDASEFLKFFKSDGTAANPNLNPVRQKSPSKRLCKFDSGDAIDAPWPDISQVRYHDIYYHKEDVDEQEIRCAKLKARAQALETASTCSYKQVQSPATMRLRTPKKENDSGKDTKTRRGSKLSPKAKGAKYSPGAKCRRYSPVYKSPRKLKQRMVQPARAATQKARGRSSTREQAREHPQHSKESEQEKSTHSDAATEKAKKDLKESRSQRHKRKLEEVVKAALVSHGIAESDQIFKPCANRLYTLVKCFVKDLATSHNLRQEMINLADEHVSGVIEFQRKRAINNQK